METSVEDEQRFDRQLEQLDRYLDDQILVLRRQKGILQREDTLRKRDRATSHSTLRSVTRSIQSLQAEIQRTDQRIETLRDGESSEYETWRARLFERRYKRPEVERILEADFCVLPRV